MKTAIALMLTFLVTILFTGCGEEPATTATTTNADVTTTVAADTDTTVSNDTTTTTAATTTTTLPITDHANDTGGTITTTTTTTITTAKPTGTLNIVDPKNYKDTYYYVGALQPDGSGLVRPRILFDGEYAVVMYYMYSDTKEDDDQQPFEYQGKTYYGQGEGMSPYQFELTETEIIVKDSNNHDIVIMKLVLRSDGTMYVTDTTDHYFPQGLILKPTAQ